MGAFSNILILYGFLLLIIATITFMLWIILRDGLILHTLIVWLSYLASNVIFLWVPLPEIPKTTLTLPLAVIANVFLARVLARLAETEFDVKKALAVILFGVTLTAILFTSDLPQHIGAIPVSLAVAYPLFISGLRNLRSGREKAYTIKGLSIVFIIYSLYMVFVPYLLTSQKEVVAYFFTVSFMFAFSIFLIAAILEKISVKNEQISAKLKYQEMIFSSAKMAAIGTMAGGMSHEINNPLAIMKVIVEDAIERTRDEKTDMTSETCDNLLNQIGRIAKIVGSLKRISKEAPSSEKKTVVLGEVMEDVLAFCRTGYAEKGIDIIYDAAGQLMNAKVVCTQSDLSQVLLNLMQNAYDAISDCHGKKWIKIGVAERMGEILISVMNSGTKISEEIANNLFNPFFTTKVPGKGTGLGLSVSKSIMEISGGALEYNGNAEYTDFIITLKSGISCPL